ncbi:MAG: thiosulfate oxidation carrier protein SoxY [Nitrospirota bacterium]
METKIRKVSRREFFKVSALAGAMALTVPKALVGTAYAQAVKKAKNPNKLTEEEKAHVPKIEVPPIAEDGSTVPINVTVDHPMTKDHYIKSIEILAYKDPIGPKGKYNLTPANGKAYISTQARIQESQPIIAIAECSQHGKWMGSADIKVTVGGC